MCSDVAIRVEGLGKCYSIYERPQDRLKQAIVPRLQRLAGREPTRYYREFWALRDVSFEVKRGETVGIIGRNGSGKSTLLQIICGTLSPTCGTVEKNGRVAALLELGSGFNPEFTGRENVYLNASILGLTNEAIDVRFNDIVEFADIGDFIEQPVKTYSSGMVVRLAFAVIAHVDADILVIDEALAVGDAFFVQKCMRFLRKFMERGTVLFVSHDTGAVINLCQRAVWLVNGRVAAAGTPKDVTDSYLAKLYEAQQGAHDDERPKESTAVPARILSDRDMRQDFINGTLLRNDIECFAFKEDSPSFGKGGARIESITLTDGENLPLTWVVGGELVTLSIMVHARVPIERPIIGFYVRDRLGQTLFGDNTFLSHKNSGLALSRNDRLVARFKFRMPILPTGDYSVSAAIADGTQHDHVQHQWMHDALMLKSHSSSACTGLMGIPMHNIELKRGQE